MAESKKLTFAEARSELEQIAKLYDERYELDDELEQRLERLKTRLEQSGLTPRVEDDIGEYEGGGYTISADVKRRLFLGSELLAAWTTEVVGEAQAGSSGFCRTSFDDDNAPGAILGLLDISSIPAGFPSDWFEASSHFEDSSEEDDEG